MIKDSGNRRQFDSGAVRDIQEGKGRMDLCPLGVFADILYDVSIYPVIAQISYPEFEIVKSIHEFMCFGSVKHLYHTLYAFNVLTHWSIYEMFIEVSKHYEEGAIKYGEHNWEKGIPLHCYIDSGLRHLFKYLRGMKDEPHDRAFVWNILGAIWTVINKPDCIDIQFTSSEEVKQ